MEDRETARMRKYGESKTTRIMKATVPHVTSGLGLRKFQADGFLLTRVYLLLLLFIVISSYFKSVCLHYISKSRLYVFRSLQRWLISDGLILGFCAV